MFVNRLVRYTLIACTTAALVGCGGFGSAGLFGGKKPKAGSEEAFMSAEERKFAKRPKIQSLFKNSDNPNTTLEVNRYIWAASLEVLNFLPIESVDPFSGVIVTGYGTPPGGGRAYRATVLVQDPALDARSLKLSLQSKGGAVDPATVRAVEDAILTRARQLRVQDGKL